MWSLSISSIEVRVNKAHRDKGHSTKLKTEFRLNLKQLKQHNSNIIVVMRDIMRKKR